MFSMQIETCRVLKNGQCSKQWDGFWSASQNGKVTVLFGGWVLLIAAFSLAEKAGGSFFWIYPMEQ